MVFFIDHCGRKIRRSDGEGAFPGRHIEATTSQVSPDTTAAKHVLHQDDVRQGRAGHVSGWSLDLKKVENSAGGFQGAQVGRMPARAVPLNEGGIRPELTTALVRALFEEWAQSGYAAVSLERVAARAGAGKAAIYRRWSSKLEFVCEAMQSVALTLSDFSDHGSLGADISAYLRTTRVTFRHPLIRRIIPDAVAERIRTPEVSVTLDRLTAARRQLGNRMLDRAIARNELQPALDRELALDLLISTLYMRMIVHSKKTTMAEIDRQAIAIEAAIKAC